MFKQWLSTNQNVAYISKSKEYLTRPEFMAHMVHSVIYCRLCEILLISHQSSFGKTNETGVVAFWKYITFFQQELIQRIGLHEEFFAHNIVNVIHTLPLCSSFSTFFEVINIYNITWHYTLYNMNRQTVAIILKIISITRIFCKQGRTILPSF